MADVTVEPVPAPAAAPSRLISKALSMTGRQAKFGSAEEEITRILANEKNYYIVLKVRKDTESADIRRNYLKLQSLLHPDKCSLEKAANASSIVNTAYDTLTTSIKKKLYDAYIDDVQTDAPEGMSYADWEANMAGQPVRLPAWLEKILRIPGMGILLLLILFPLTIILLILAFVFWLICLPINIICNCCCGAPVVEEQAAAEGPTSAPKAQEMGSDAV